MNYKKIIVFIISLILISSFSLADDLNIVDSATGVDFQLYLVDTGELYGVGVNDQGELGMGSSGAAEYEELTKITDGVLLPQTGESSIKRTICAGADFSVIIKNDNKVYASGENYFGQLGVGDNSDRNEFLPMNNVYNEEKDKHYNENIVSVSAGADFVLLLNSDGEVFGVGDNAFGQIKANGQSMYTELIDVYTPSTDDASKKAKAIATGSRHSVILLEDGTVITLGDNEYHQRDITIPSGKKIKEVAVGSYHTLAVLDDGSVWGVGSNEEQQLVAHVSGGSTLNQYRSTMVQLLDENGNKLFVDTSVPRIRNITAGYDFSMAIKGDGENTTVVGVGNKYRNQLGKEAKTKNSNSVKIETMDEVKNINANWRHSVIMGKKKGENKTESKGNKFYGEVSKDKPIKEENEKSIAMGAGHTLYVKDEILYGAGANQYGQLGLPTYSSYVRKIPFDIAAVGGIKQIATGAAHSVILGFDGSVWVTGYNYSGQLGLGDNKDRKSFTRLVCQFDSPVIAIAAGGDVTMMLTQSGNVYAMGDNSYKQIDNSENKRYNTPTVYSENQNIISIGAGVRYTMALTADSNVIAKGENVVNTANVNPYVKKIAVGPYHSLFLLTDGSVYASGKNTDGQLGLGDVDSPKAGNIRDFPAGVNVKDIVAGYNHSVFLTSDGIYVAGNDDGNGAKELPTKIDSLGSQEVKDIAAGWLGNILKTATTILTIGDNTYAQRGVSRGEEGQGYEDDISSLTKKKIAAGDGCTMILHSDGTLWGIGKNDKGQLGTGDTNSINIFTKINTPVSLGDIVDVQMTGNTTFVLTRDGDVYVTGMNKFNLLDKDYVTNFVPVNLHDVKKIFVKNGTGLSMMVVLKNDGSVFFNGSGIINGEYCYTSDSFINIPLELETGEFVKNVILTDIDIIFITSNGREEDVIGGIEEYKQVKKEETYGYYKISLKNNAIYASGTFDSPGNELKYEVDSVSGELKAVSMEGVNEMNNSNNTSNLGKPFSELEEIEDIATSSTHIVVLTKSGQIYTVGDNTIDGDMIGILGNETLNDKNVTFVPVFVPTYLQSIAPTTGVIVK